MSQMSPGDSSVSQATHRRGAEDAERQKSEGFDGLRLVFSTLLALCFILLGAGSALAGGPSYYTLGPGETLGTAARRLGVRVETLVTLNALPDPSFVRPGQRILVPERQARLTHQAQAGETLAGIAVLYGMDANALASANGLTAGDRIEAGRTLTVTLSSSSIGDAALPSGPIAGAALAPWPALQGQTVALRVALSRPVSLTVSFNGADTPAIAEGGQAWALLGVPPMAAPGFYPIRLRATAGVSETWEATLRLYVAAGVFDTYDIVLDPSSGKDWLLDPKVVQAEWERVTAVYAGRTPARRWDGVFAAPLPETALLVTSMFGERRSYNSGPVSSFHEGTDYGAPGGTPVYAPAGAVVVLADALNVRGNAVILDHGLGVFTGYWHLSAVVVKAGDVVRAGDLIGRVGATGLSTGDHLHWELRVNSVAVDAAQWLFQAMP
jgi:murein DD-endopeptidase MepM/ murein hydrolase activator NlpD